MRKINAYDCDNQTCHHLTVTVQIADGITPMFSDCEKCGGPSTSRMFDVPQDLEPTIEWYKPDEAELLNDDKLAHYVSNGGLMPRRIAVAP
jgi:hypothetical protein